MDQVNSEMTFLVGLVAGAAGLGCVWAFGPALAATGWTSVVTAGGLAAAAGLTYLRKEAEVVPAVKRGPETPPSGPEAWRQAEDPGEWSSQAGAGDVPSIPDAERRGFMRGRLAGCLTALPSDWAEPGSIQGSRDVGWLAVALAALSAGRSNEARQLLSDLATFHYPGGQGEGAGLASRVGALAADGKVAGILGDAAGLHGTVETAMMHLLRQARISGGVLGTGEFTWLKGRHRGLWYALGNLGRSTYLVEGLAAMAHYRAETAAGRASREPLVDAAVEALLALPPTPPTARGGPGSLRVPGRVALP